MSRSLSFSLILNLLTEPKFLLAHFRFKVVAFSLSGLLRQFVLSLFRFIRRRDLLGDTGGAEFIGVSGARPSEVSPSVVSESPRVE